MNFVKGADRNTITFLPDCLDDFVSEDSYVRVIDAFADSLDSRGIGFTNSTPSENCRPSYNPLDMVKLYFYGYVNSIKSSRKLMRECTRNIELMWLLKKLTPDFRTIANFRKDNAKQLKEVFREFVRFCDSVKLFGKELFAIDSAKFKAVNSLDNWFSKKQVDECKRRIDKNLEEYFALLDQADNVEQDTQNDKLSKEEINKAIEKLKLKKNKYESINDALIESGETQLSLIDPEARLMKSSRTFEVSYNVHTVVDAKHHLIAEYDVSNNASDGGNLKPCLDKIKDILEVEKTDIVADTGYNSKQDMLDCLLDGTFTHVAFVGKEKAEHTYLFEYEPCDITEEMKNSIKREDILKCLKAGVVPSIYENKNIELGVIDEDEEIEHMLCPNKNTFKKYKEHNQSYSYRNHVACKECKNKCKQLKEPIELTRKKNIANPQRLVRLRVVPDKEKLKLRIAIAEHPFGTVKFWNNQKHLLTKGKQKVGGEVALSFLAYNFKRVINLTKIDDPKTSIRDLLTKLKAKITKNKAS